MEVYRVKKLQLKGHDATLYLVEVSFTRRLMTDYSWAGTTAQKVIILQNVSENNQCFSRPRENMRSNLHFVGYREVL